MTVRAKFVVNTITKSMQSVKQPDGGYGPGECHSVKLFPIADSQGENAKFFASTPSGSIELNILNPAATAVFMERLGKAVYVDFTPSDD